MCKIFIWYLWSVLVLDVVLAETLLDITCDDILTFYADSNVLINQATPGYGTWDERKRVIIPSNTKIYGIKCENSGGPGGILASSVHGTYTDSRWRCTNTEPGSGWLSVGYDDSSWQPAYTMAKNNGSHWRVVRGMSRRAQWIWTNDPLDTTVYCRTDKGPQAEVTVDITCDNSVTFYADDKTIVDGSTAASDLFDDIQHVQVSIDTKVYGIKCENTGGPGGILASFSDGSVTDNGWRCTNTTPGFRWTTTFYDDNWWDEASEIQQNDVSSVWDAMVDVSNQAKWIWTPQWNGGDKIVHCRKEKGPIKVEISMDIACDDQLTFYADGQALIDDTTPGYGVWDKIHHVDIPVGTRVYGIRCVNAGGPGGIVASFSDGTVTDGRWRCRNTVPSSSWLSAGYDDSSWSPAYSVQSNGDYYPWPGFYGVASYAEWIWTTGWNGQDNIVYCRKLAET